MFTSQNDVDVDPLPEASVMTTEPWWAIRESNISAERGFGAMAMRSQGLGGHLWLLVPYILNCLMSYNKREGYYYICGHMNVEKDDLAWARMVFTQQRQKHGPQIRFRSCRLG